MNVAAARRRRRMIREAPFIALMIAAVPLIVLTSPITLPVLAASEALRKRRMRSVADTTACQQCGELLTREAIKLADLKVAAEFAEMRAEFPHSRFRLADRKMWAICPTCGATYDWNKRDKMFLLNAADADTGLKWISRRTKA